jgi:hypothetical protein
MCFVCFDCFVCGSVFSSSACASSSVDCAAAAGGRRMETRHHYGQQRKKKNKDFCFNTFTTCLQACVRLGIGTTKNVCVAFCVLILICFVSFRQFESDVCGALGGAVSAAADGRHRRREAKRVAVLCGHAGRAGDDWIGLSD